MTPTRFLFLFWSLIAFGLALWGAPYSRVLAQGSGQDRLFMAGGTGQDRFLALERLSDSTWLVGGSSPDLSWLPSTVTPVTLLIPANSEPASTSNQTAYLLRLSANLDQVLGAWQMPAGTVEDVRRIRVTSRPGQPTGAIYISGGRGGQTANQNGYYIARLDNNFVSGSPTGVSWLLNLNARNRNGGSPTTRYPAGDESIVKQWQPWDVDAQGNVVYAEGQDFSFDVLSVNSVDAQGRGRIVDKWPIHRYLDGSRNITLIPAQNYRNTTGNPDLELSSSYVWLKYAGTGQKGTWRSYTQALYDSLMPDENGNPGRKGSYPTDRFFAAPEDLTPGVPYNAPSPGPTGLRANLNGNWVPRLSHIEIDRQTGFVYYALTFRVSGPTDIPNTEDLDPALLATRPDGQVAWWARLYQETPLNSPIQQNIDKLAIDYTNQQLVVQARSRGDFPINFWQGDRLRLNPNGQGWQNRLTGVIVNSNQANDYAWIGKYGLADGKIRFATYLTGYGPVAPPSAGQTIDRIRPFPMPNSVQAQLSQTRVEDVSVMADGSVIVAGTGSRMVTTRDGFQPSLHWSEGAQQTTQFIQVLTPDLSQLRYGSIYTPVLAANEGTSETDVRILRVYPTRQGLVWVGRGEGASMVPVVAAPAWASSNDGHALMGMWRLKSLNDPTLPVRLHDNRLVAQGTGACDTILTISLTPRPSGVTRYIWLTEGVTGSSDTAGIVVRRSGTAGGAVTVVALSPGGVSQPLTLQIPALTGQSPAAPFLMTPSQVCQGAPIQVNATSAPGAVRYRYRLVGAGCPAYTLSADSTVGPSVTVTLNQSQADSCFIEAIAVGCEGVSAPGRRLLPRQSTPAPLIDPADITPVEGLCIGLPRQIVYDDQAEARQFQWRSLTPGLVTDSSRTSVLTVTATAPIVGSPRVSIRAIGPCGPGDSLVITLPAVTASAPPTLSNIVQTPQVACSLDTIVLRATVQGGRPIFRSLSGNLRLLDAAGDSARFVAPANNANVVVLVTGENVCGIGTGTPKLIRVGIPTDGPAVIPGGLIACRGSRQRIEIPRVTSAETYTWTLPTGYTGASDSNAIEVLVTASAVAGQITVTPSNRCGASRTGVLNVDGALTNTLAAAISPASAGIVCGNTAINFWAEAQGLTSSSQIIWSLPPGWAQQNASRIDPAGDTILVYATPQASPGALQLTIQEGTQCGIANLVLTPGDQVRPGLIQGPALTCVGGLGPLTYSLFGGSINDTLIYTLSDPAAGTLSTRGTTTQLSLTPGYTGTVMIMATGQACNLLVTPTAAPLTVQPAPTVTLTGLDPAYCNAPGTVTLTASPTGGIVTVNGVVQTGSTAALTDTGRYVIIYTLNESNGCQGADTIVSVVRPIAAPVLSRPLDTACNTQSFVVLSAAQPAGGVWSGPGVRGDTAFLAALTIGQTLEYTYTITAVGGCQGRAVQRVFIAPPPTITLTGGIAAGAQVCQTAGRVFLGQPSQTPGTWTGPAPVVGDFVDVSGLSGSVTFQYVGTGGAGCPGGTTLGFTVVAPPAITLTAPQTSFCAGGGALSLTLTGSPTGGTFSGPATDPMTGVVQVNQLTAGVNRIFYTLTTGPCISRDSITLTITAPLDASVRISRAQVCAGDTARLIPAVPGGVFEGMGIDVATGLITAPTTPGRYTFRYRQTAGACPSLDFAELTVIDVTPTIALDNLSICQGTVQPVQASVTNNRTGGLFGGLAGIDAQSGLIDARLLTPGTYTITYQGVFEGCPGQAQTTLTVRPTPVVEAGLDITACPGISVTLPTAGPGQSWSGPGVASTGGAVDTTALPTGVPVTYRLTEVQDGCQSTDSLTVTRLPAPPLQNQSPTQSVTIGSATAPFSITSQLPTQQITWTPVSGLSSAGILTPTASPTETTMYELTVVYENGCQASTQVVVTVTTDPTQPPGRPLFIRNLITPNRDGENDTWILDHTGAQTARVRVLNRQGQTVFQSDTYQNDWDGGDLPAGTYYFTVHHNDRRYTGPVTIVR